jgi:nicotinate-nucleotide adenylyltransferase
VAGTRLGIFGGTFDPVHNAHLAAAQAARDAARLDEVRFVVAAAPWQKEGAVVAPAEARYEMVVAAIDDIRGFTASRVEVDRPGPTYTIDTVEAFLAQEPGIEQIVLVVGGDVAARLDPWHRADELRALVEIAAVTRPGFRLETPPGWRVQPVEMPPLDISSTDIRARVANGLPVDDLMPAAAVRVLRAYGLYTRC